MQVSVSPEINQLVDAAANLSVQRGDYYVGVEHLFDALLENSSLLPGSFADEGMNTLLTISRALQGETWQGRMPVTSYDVFYTPRCAAVIQQAAKFAERLSAAQPAAGHLLLAILADAHAVPSRVMDRLELGRGEFIQRLREELMHLRATDTPQPMKAPPEAETAAPEEPAKLEQNAPAAQRTKPKKDALASLTRDLTRAARSGHIEPAIGRDQEMFEVLQILTRKNKNNVMLVGEAGVGKTKVVEGLALAAATGATGGVLKGQRILELNVAAVMSGTKYRGAFEEKMQALLEDLKKSRDAILFIDEAHLIMGAGATEGGGVDLANLLKPALARGELRCIGATTMQEYRRFIEKDPAMERRFQMVRVGALSDAATYDVLKSLRPSLEKHHRIRISRRALRAAIELTQRYMPNRQLPDKAIDVLDQACARYRLKAVAARSNPRMFDSSPPEPPEKAKVRPHDIRRVISQITAIPVEEMTAEERARLGAMQNRLKRSILGQDEAVDRVVAAVKKARAGLADPHRPDAVMLFLGPSGVGKTQLAKELADILFGSADHLITFDMSEYIEEHSVSRLLGAPPGYAGYEEEGRLSAAVRNMPFSILLFDEIEKAHRRIFDLFLPIFEEGRLKDNRGREVNFRNCIIIMTSNVGSHVLKEGEQDYEAELMSELRRQFRPEFINRIDEIVPFYPLVFEDVRAILEKAIEQLQLRLRHKHVRVHLYQGAYEYLGQEGYDPQWGARELKRTVERLVVSPISELVLSEEIARGDTIEVLMEDGELEIRLAARESAPQSGEQVTRT